MIVLVVLGLLLSVGNAFAVPSADELYFPKACQEKKELSDAQWETLASYGKETQRHQDASPASTVPFVGELVVQRRLCAKRSTRVDCSPWVQDDVVVGAARTITHLGVDRALMTLQHRTSYGQDIRVSVSRTGTASVRTNFYMTRAGSTLSILREKADPVQLNSRCLRLPYRNLILPRSDVSYDELRIAAVAIFSPDLFNDPSPLSPLNRNSCDGDPMTVTEAENRFPQGSGSESVAVAASIRGAHAERKCRLSETTGTECGEWSEAACAEEWCKNFQAKPSVVFQQVAGGKIGINVSAAGSNSLYILVHAAASTVNYVSDRQYSLQHSAATLTNRCARQGLFLEWTGGLSDGWTERRGALLVKF